MESAELQQANKRIRLLEMGNAGLRPAVRVSGTGHQPKMMFPHYCAISRSRGSRFRCPAGCWGFPGRAIAPGV